MTVQAPVRTAARTKHTAAPLPPHNPNTFDGRVLTAAHQPDVLRLTDGAGLPMVETLRSALQNGQVVGDDAGLPSLQAAAALLPLYDAAVLPTALRAVGYGTDGQGAVLTPPVLTPDYAQLRPFLRMALRWAAERYAGGPLWAVLELPQNRPYGEELCAQYLSCGLVLCALRPMAGATLLIFSARARPRWQEPFRRVGLYSPALPHCLARGAVAADFGWGDDGLELLLRPAR